MVRRWRDLKHHRPSFDPFQRDLAFARINQVLLEETELADEFASLRITPLIDVSILIQVSVPDLSMTIDMPISLTDQPPHGGRTANAGLPQPTKGDQASPCDL